VQGVAFAFHPPQVVFGDYLYNLLLKHSKPNLWETSCQW